MLEKYIFLISTIKTIEIKTTLRENSKVAFLYNKRADVFEIS